MKVAEPTAAYKAAKTILKNKLQEGFVALAIGARCDLLDDPWLVALGTAICVEVHPRDIFREAILRNAVSLIVAHNHPSGDPSPSKEDDVLTHRIIKAGQILGIPLVDHIVLGTNEYFSYSRTGRLSLCHDSGYAGFGDKTEALLDSGAIPTEHW
jgi:DNA repair protein RadC